MKPGATRRGASAPPRSREHWTAIPLTTRWEPKRRRLHSRGSERFRFATGGARLGREEPADSRALSPAIAVVRARRPARPQASQRASAAKLARRSPSPAEAERWRAGGRAVQAASCGVGVGLAMPKDGSPREEASPCLGADVATTYMRCSCTAQGCVATGIVAAAVGDAGDGFDGRSSLGRRAAGRRGGLETEKARMRGPSLPANGVEAVRPGRARASCGGRRRRW